MGTRVRIDPSSRLPFDEGGAVVSIDALAAGSAEARPGVPSGVPPAELAPAKGAAPYVELTARSCFSFLQGASPPEKIVQRAAAYGYDAVAITDRDGIYGAVRAHEEAVRCGIRLVLGCELTAATKPPFPTVTLLVEDHAGYTNLCRLLTASHGAHPKGKPRRKVDGLPRNTFAGLAPSVIAERAGGLWAIVHPGVTPGHGAGEDERLAATLKEAFGARLSVGLHRHLDGGDRARGRVAERVAKQLDLPLSALNLVRYADREEKPILDVIECIREGTTLDAAGRALAPNAEAHLKKPEAMARLFSDHPAAVERTREVADACRFQLTELRYRFPCELEAPAFAGETPNQALRRMAYDGATDRYGGRDRIPAGVVTQIEKELALIAELDVAPYFLSVRTIVDMARRRDILCQGRGSAANSAVCYALGITAVDPSRSNLLFERFLSAERHEPPDIDVDFEHERREEVIQEIYDTYGRDRAAMVSEVVCYRGKSALRDVGKVFGLSLEQVERLATVVEWFDPVRSVDGKRLQNAGFDPDDARVRQVVAMAHAIQGFPRHLSIHVGGFVLSAEPLDRVAPVEPATMPGRTVIPWDKDDLDTLGFFKVDVLGLGILSAIRRALDFAAVRDPRIRAGTAIDRLAKVPPEDPIVYEALCHADTVGVFQIESRAQMSMLPRLQPRTFYDLVVEVAIVRPGPIQGGMIHPYLRRRNGQEDATSPHPTLAPILDRTLGVPLFQEQVMQIAIVGAGYTGGEADQLRRDMAAWRKDGRLARHRERLIDGFTKRGIDPEFGERIYAQIQGFGEYGFPESHAASFALLVYASAWIKVHHPAAFAAALVNSQPMGFYSPSTILQDAQRHGVELRPICIQESEWDCTLEPIDEDGEDGEASDPSGAAGAVGPALRVGLRQVNGLGEAAGRRIEEARRRGGEIASIADLAARAQLDRRELELLAESGALGDRRAALWEVRSPAHEGLLACAEEVDAAPVLPLLSRAETLALDYQRTGFSVSDHPMRYLRPRLPRHVKTGAALLSTPHGRRVSVAGLVICRQRPQTASGVVFVTLEDETGFINLILFARVFEEQRHVATTSTVLLVRGKVERDGEVVYVIAERMESVALRETALPTMSRDFH